MHWVQFSSLLHGFRLQALLFPDGCEGVQRKGLAPLWYSFLCRMASVLDPMSCGYLGAVQGNLGGLGTGSRAVIDPRARCFICVSLKHPLSALSMKRV
jgi:hypothetical protein